MNFNGKCALVTGAAVGIGRACAINFAKNGAKVVAVDINPATLEKLEKEILEYTGDVLTLVCDVADENAVNETVKKAEERFEKVDILVNNAALWREWASFVDIPSEIWRRFFDINVMGTVHFTKAVLPKMIDNGFGRIINVASVAGVYGNANMVNYSTTKGAVIAMTRGLAKEVADKGITVNAVSPGSVSPAENPDMDYVCPSELAFMGRTGSDNENANLILFLASDGASYISGQNIQIDGCRRKQ